MASAQELSRVGECVDLYYYDAETSKKQCFGTTQNTKFVVEFNNKAGGSNVFTFPPQCGLQDIVVNMSFAALSSTDISGRQLALPRGWGYALIERASFRYAGASQFFLSGQQLLQNALRCQTSRSSCDDLLTLGGNAAANTDLLNPQYASVVLRLPHNICSGVGKSHPLPTDLITQQVQVTLELKPVSSIWTNVAGTALPNNCLSLASAQFQAQQVMLNNMGDSLSRRVDMSVNAYSFPCEFVQNVVSLDLPANTNVVPAQTLTGFRAGSVKSIQVWCQDKADVATNSSTGSTTGYNPFNWVAPASIEMLYAGDIYARFDSPSAGPLFNLVNGNKSPAFDNVTYSVNAGAIVQNNKLAQWLELPFAQTLVDEDSHYIYVAGKAITNGIINLQNITLPYASAAGWTLFVSYVYSTNILISQGTMDWVF